MHYTVRRATISRIASLALTGFSALRADLELRVPVAVPRATRNQARQARGIAVTNARCVLQPRRSSRPARFAATADAAQFMQVAYEKVVLQCQPGQTQELPLGKPPCADESPPLQLSTA